MRHPDGAPPGSALMASLMNIALQAGGLLTKYLNNVFVVDRGQYDNLGRLMIVSTAVTFLVPLATIAIVATQIKLGAAAGANGKGASG